MKSKKFADIRRCSRRCSPEPGPPSRQSENPGLQLLVHATLDCFFNTMKKFMSFTREKCKKIDELSIENQHVFML